MRRHCACPAIGATCGRWRRMRCNYDGVASCSALCCLFPCLLTRRWRDAKLCVNSCEASMEELRRIARAHAKRVGKSCDASRGFMRRATGRVATRRANSCEASRGLMRRVARTGMTCSGMGCDACRGGWWRVGRGEGAEGKMGRCVIIRAVWRYRTESEATAVASLSEREQI